MFEQIAHLLIYHEQPGGFAHGRSFVLSALRDLLTVAHLSWAIWANPSQSLIWFERNEQMCDEWMCEFPALTFVQFLFLVFNLADQMLERFLCSYFCHRSTSVLEGFLRSDWDHAFGPKMVDWTESIYTW